MANSPVIGFVLDASVTLRWALLDGSGADRAYADAVLTSRADTPAYVPALWCVEVIHVLRGADTAGKMGEAALAAFVYQLSHSPIHIDAAAAQGLMLQVAAMGRENRITAYDAQYFELVRRFNMPLATLDKDLRKAAKKIGVAIYLS